MEINKQIKIILLITIIIFKLMNIASAVPMNISYQGFILDNNGSPINSSVSITFNLYSKEVDNQSLWNETHTEVIVTDGIFNVILGTENAFTNDLFDNDLYLDISIDGSSEISPRRKLTSTAFSIRAHEADYAKSTNIGDHSIDITKLAFADQDGNIEIPGNIVAKTFIGDGSQLTGIVKKETDPVWTNEASKYWTKDELKRNSSREYSGAYNIGVSDSFLNSNSTNLQDVLDNLDQAISKKQDKIEIPDFSWEEVTTSHVDFDIQCEYRWYITNGVYDGYVFVPTYLNYNFLCCTYSVDNQQCILKGNVTQSTGDLGTYTARVYKRCGK